MIVKGSTLVIDKANIDTDQIIPAKHLSGIDKGGVGEFLFTGMPNGPQLLADHPEATILVTGENVGCGSSREHAVWALQFRHFKAVIAPSFARIFQENCYTNALVPVTLAAEQVRKCMAARVIEIDVTNEVVRTDAGDEFAFHLDPLRKRFILEGGFMDFMHRKIPDVRKWLAEREKRTAAAN